MDNINKIYLNKENIKEIKNNFGNKEFPLIVLKDFLDESLYKKVVGQIKGLRFKKEINLLQHSYSVSETPKDFNDFLNSNEFLDFISSITNLKIKSINSNVFCFSWRDYTILNDKYLEEPNIDVIFDFTEDWKIDFGGSIVYVDETGDYFKINPEKNSLIIAKRSENIYKFFQYINNLARYNKRYFIIGKIN